VSIWNKSVATTSDPWERTEGLAPGGFVAPRSMSQAVVLHDPGDGACGQAYSEFEQLTLDPAIAPSLVLPCREHHQGDRLVIDGRTTW
jgi:hypothetical protein